MSPKMLTTPNSQRECPTSREIPVLMGFAILAWVVACTLSAQCAPQLKTPPPANAAKLPTVLHFCAQHCMTFTLEVGQLTNHTNFFGQQNEKRVLTVESFTPQKVIIHRVDTGSNPMTSDYSGQMCADGNTLSGNGWKMAWGAALNTLPGDDNERALQEGIAAGSHTPPAMRWKGRATPALGPIPPPDVSGMKIGPPQADPDIGGTWQQDAQPANRYAFPQVKMLMVAFGNEFVGINLERVPFLAEDGSYVIGTYSSPTSFKTSIKDFNDSGVVKWYLADMSFPSPDHLTLVVKEGMKEEKRFTRISKIAPGELPCDLQNPTHVSGPEALARSILYFTEKKNDTAGTCWAYIGAKEGDAEAEVEYGDFLAKGNHVKENDAAAFQLYQRSAMKGNFYGVNRLAGVFGSDNPVAPESIHRRDYWGARMDWIDPGYVHTKSFLRITPWALDTALPCEAGNPRGLNGDAVFRAGRVAFQARAGDVAECWFQISSNQGTKRADVYLGVMYYFGIGVEQNRALGLERLKKAADAKDPFGMMYLASLFRWGIGVPVNQQLGYAMMQEANAMPNGEEIFSRVEGIVGGLAPSSPGAEARARCAELREQVKANRFNDANLNYEASHCDATDDVLGAFNTTANHTVDHPEEIFPEIFDPITLPANDDLKQRAAYGVAHLTP